MKINLAIKDRLVIGGVLPQQGDIRTMTIVEDIRKKTALTQEEIDQADFRVENNAYKWDSEKAKSVEIIFSDAENDLIMERFQELDKEKAVTPEILQLYRLFKN